MDPLSITASVIAVLQVAGTVLGYLNSIKDAAKDRARCAMEISIAYSHLTALRCRLEELESSEQDSSEPWFAAVEQLAVQNGPLDQFKEALEQLSSKIAPKHGVKKVGEVLVWKLTKAEVESILARIVRLQQLVQIAMEMDHFKLSEAIKNETAELKTIFSKMHEDFRNMVITEEDQRVLEWLTPHDFTPIQSDLRSRRQAHTGQWFLGSTEFSNWLVTPKATLFCPGIPGAGKTMISSLVVDELLKQCQDNKIGFAYLYCNHKRQEEQNFSGLISAMLRQLARAQSSVTHSIRTLHNRHEKKHLYLVIDALDECKNEDKTLDDLLSLLQKCQTDVDLRILLTSRPVPHVINCLGDHITLEIRASETDLKLYLEAQMSRLPKFVCRDLSLQCKIKARIIQIVDGMFLLARLHFDSLTDRLTPKALKGALEALPKGPSALYEAYNSALERIDSQYGGHRALAKDALSWIVCAKRPLTPDEILHALAVDPTDTEFDEENMPDLDDALSACAGLIRVNDQSQTVEVVHYTVQEYLLEILPRWLPTAHETVGRVCLSYLSFDGLHSGNADYNPRGAERYEHYRLLDYASRHWPFHYCDAREALKTAALDFLQKSSLVDETAGLYWRHHEAYFRLNGLHLAACFGLDDLLDGLLLQGIPADCKDSYFQCTALYWAVEQGHESTVKRLVARTDVDPGSRNRYDETPFLAAAENGHLEILKFLAGVSGVNTAAVDDSGRNALHMAAISGNLAAVQYVLTLEDIHPIPNRVGEKPFQLAAMYGHTEIMSLLLEIDSVGADWIDEEGWTALHFAAFYRGEAIVRALLGRDDVYADHPDKGGVTPLFKAILGHNPSVVRLLLERGVDYNRQTNGGVTPLGFAKQCGQSEIVEMLEEKGAIFIDGDLYSWKAGEESEIESEEEPEIESEEEPETES